MKRTYPVISNKYVVDKSIKDYDQRGWWLYMDRFVGGTCIMSKDIIQFKDQDEGIHTLYKKAGDHESLHKIVATIGERISSFIPVIQFQDTPTTEFYKTPYINGSGLLHDVFVLGYKTAQAKGKWSDEDMRKMFIKGTIAQTNHLDYNEEIDNALLKFGQPTITKIELETENIYEDRWLGEMMVPVHQGHKLKITKLLESGPIIII